MKGAQKHTLWTYGRVAVLGVAGAIAIAACGGGGGSASLSGNSEGSSASGQQAPAAQAPAAQAPAAQAPAANQAPSTGTGSTSAVGGTGSGSGSAASSTGTGSTGSGYSAPAAGTSGGSAPVAKAAPNTGSNPGQVPNPVGKAVQQPNAPVASNGSSDVGITEKTITLGRIDFESATRSLGSLIAEPSTVVEQGIVDWINQQGGINGRKLVMLKCDDGGDMTRAVACYQKLKSQVFLFVPSETWLTEIAHQYVDRDKVPMFTWGWFLSEFSDPYMFPCHANGEKEAIAQTNWITARKTPKTVSIVYLNVTEDINAANSAAKIYEAKGIKVLNKIPYEWDSPDESQHVLALRVANPELVAIYGWPGPTAKLMHDADEQHWAPPMGYWLNHLTLDPGYGPVYGNYIKGKLTAITSFQYPPDVSPGNTFWEFITKNYGGYNLEGLRWKYAAGHHVTQASVGCMRVIFNVLRELGPNPTRAAFIDFAETHQFDSGMGVVFRWPKGNHNMDPYGFNREYQYEWIDSQAQGPGGNQGYDQVRVLPDPLYRSEIEPCKAPKVEDCRPMLEPGTILKGANLYYHDLPYYS